MLLIRRRPQESILIGDSIEIQVLEISRGQVKLGVTAPTEVLILRKEILLTETENRAASRSISGTTLEALVQAFRPGPESAPHRAARESEEASRGISRG